MLIEVHYHYESDFKAHILDLSRYKGAYILNGLPKILNHNILFIEPDIVKNPTVTDIETEKVNVTWDAPDGLADDYTVTSAALEGWNSKHGTPCTEGNAVGGTRWRTVCGLHPGSQYRFTITASSGGVSGLPATTDEFTGIHSTYQWRFRVRGGRLFAQV